MLHQDLRLTCQQPLISSFPVSSPTRVQTEPTTPSGGSGAAIATTPPFTTHDPTPSPTLLQSEPTSPSGGSVAIIAGVVAALMVAVIVIITVVVIAYFLYK